MSLQASRSLRPASARRLPKRFEEAEHKETDWKQETESKRRRISATSENRYPELSRHSACPTLPLDYPDLGPSELVKAGWKCPANGDHSSDTISDTIRDTTLPAETAAEITQQVKGLTLEPSSPKDRQSALLSSRRKNAFVVSLPTPSYDSSSDSNPNMSTSMFSPDDINWGSDEESHQAPGPLEYPNSSHLRPYHGAYTMLNRVAVGDYTFAELTTRHLRLSRSQICCFLTKYIAQHRAWVIYDENITKIPWKELQAYAVQRKASVGSLIHCYRPTLPTDEISRDDITKATSFLQGKGLEGYVEGLDDWFGIGKMDFLDLDVNDAMIRDTLDMAAIRNAREWGWIDLDQVLQTANERADMIRREAHAKCPIGDVFLGAPSRVVTHTSSKPGVLNNIQDGIHVTPNSNRLVWSGILKNIDAVVPASLIHKSLLPITIQDVAKDRNRRADRNRRVPTKAQDEQVRLSLGRQLPSLLPQFVPGNAVETTVERARRYTTGNQVHPPVDRRRYRAADPSNPSAVLLESRKSGSKLADQDLRKLATAQASQCYLGPKGVNGAQNGQIGGLGGSPIVATSSNELVTKGRGSRASQAHQAVNRRSGHALDSQDHKGANTIQVGLATTNNTQASDATSNKSLMTPVDQTNSAQLREFLDSKYSSYLHTDGKASPPKPKKSSCKLESPEAEDDLEYTPTKTPTNKRKATVQIQKKFAKYNKVAHTAGQLTNLEGSARRQGIGSRTSTSQVEPKFVGAHRTKGMKSLRENERDSDDSDLPLRRQIRKRTANTSLSRDENTAADNKPTVEPTKTKKNIEPIFGISRGQSLTSPLKRTQEAEYAWSAERADFAAVSEYAQYALKADRLVKNDTVKVIEGSDQWKDAWATLKKLQVEFEMVEDGQRSQAAQDANKVKYAGCADWAIYAAEAKEAQFAMEVIGLVEEETKEDGGQIEVRGSEGDGETA
ncbi:hypothetical protein QQS21_000266 [Conoideocrella luteorostrata]|uniref:Uncharacterized protein n=1 Tax=Conoideocrella luteorostrata TaxID=1105319 RepID=A0AAJ0CZD1_9HYPO|nr:hypothetical protein QQS21_000266 [Conoideocrella luteorostrata]